MITQLCKGGEFNAASPCEQEWKRGTVPAQSWNSSINRHLSVEAAHTRVPLSVVARIFPRPGLFFSHQAPSDCALRLPHDIIQTRLLHVQER
jgi:hypothetical protein